MKQCLAHSKCSINLAIIIVYLLPVLLLKNKVHLPQELVFSFVCQGY